MSDSLAGLVVSLTLEYADYQAGFTRANAIAKESAGSIGSSFSSVGSAVDAAERQVQSFGISLGALGGVAAGGGLGALVTHAVEAETHMLHLAQVTGTTVEALSSMTPAAAASGTSLDAVSSMSDKLSKNLATAGDNGNEATKVLTALGFSAQQLAGFLDNPAVAMQQIAQRLQEIPDGGTKSAAAMVLFGKSGAEAIPFLKALVEQGQLNATMTTAQTKAADTFHTALTTLEGSSDAYSRSLADALLPSLTGIANAFIASNKSANDSHPIMAAVGDAFSVVALAGEVTWTAVKDLADVFVLLGAEMKALADRSMPEAKAAYADYLASTKANKEELLAFYSTLQGTSSLLTDLAQRHVQAGAASEADAAATDRLTAAQKAQLAALKAAMAGTAAASADTAGVQFINSLMAQDAALEDSETELLQYKAVQAGLVDNTGQILSSVSRQIAAYVDHKHAVADDNSELERSVKDFQALGDAITPSSTAFADEIKRVDALVESLKIRTATVGLDNLATEEAIALAKLDAAGMDKLSVTYLEDMAKIQNGFSSLRIAQGAVDAAKEASKAWQETAQTIDTSLTNALADGFKKGESLGQQLRDALESMFKKLVLQPLLQPISGSLATAFTGFASAATGSPGGAAGSLTSGVGSLGNAFTGLTSAFSGAQSLFSDFALSGAGSAIGLSTVGTTVATDAAFGGTLAAEGGAATLEAASTGAALTGAGSAVLAAIPVVGWIALAAIAAYEIFGNKGGAPKAGGFASSGDTSALGLDSNGRYYSPNDADSNLSSITSGLASTYTSSLAGLGGTGTAGFGVGYDVDAGGTADSRLSVGASVNGQSVYSVRNKDEGKGTDQLQADLTLEAQRALLAALQASDLPKDVAAIIDSVTASSATADQITNVIALGTAFKNVSDILSHNALKDVLDAVAKSSTTATSALNDQIKAAQTLTTSFKGAASESGALSNAAYAIYGAEAQLIAQSESVKGSLASLFSDTIRSFTLSTLDAVGKNKFYQDDEARLKGQLATATDPAQIQALTQAMVADLQASFGLLTPDQQASQLSQYTNAVNTINAQATARINEVETSAQTQSTNTIAQIQATLQAFADKQAATAASASSTAATNQQAAAVTNTAAQTMLAAARTPTVVVVQLNDNGEVNSGG